MKTKVNYINFTNYLGHENTLQRLLNLKRTLIIDYPYTREHIFIYTCGMYIPCWAAVTSAAGGSMDPVTASADAARGGVFTAWCTLVAFPNYLSLC